MRDQIERKVERGDETAQSNRHPSRHPVIAAGALVDAELQHLAADARGLTRRDAEGIDESQDFAARIADRFARLDAQRLRQFIAALGEAAYAVLKHVASCIGWECGHRCACLVAGNNRLADQRGIAKTDAGRALAGVFIQHVERLPRFNRLVGEVERIGFLQLHGHGIGWNDVNLTRGVWLRRQEAFSLPRAGAARHRPVAHESGRPASHRARCAPDDRPRDGGWRNRAPRSPAG